MEPHALRRIFQRSVVESKDAPQLDHHALKLALTMLGIHEDIYEDKPLGFSEFLALCETYHRKDKERKEAAAEEAARAAATAAAAAASRRRRRNEPMRPPLAPGLLSEDDGGPADGGVGSGAMALNASAIDLELNHVRRQLVGRARVNGCTPDAVIQEHRAYREGIQRAQRARHAEWQLTLLHNRDTVAVRGTRRSVWHASGETASTSAAVPRLPAGMVRVMDDTAIEHHAAKVNAMSSGKAAS